MARVPASGQSAPGGIVGANTILSFDDESSSVSQVARRGALHPASPRGMLRLRLIRILVYHFRDGAPLLPPHGESNVSRRLPKSTSPARTAAWRPPAHAPPRA